MDISKFYNTFFSADPSNVTTLDMQNTFKIEFRFKPVSPDSEKTEKNKPGLLENAGKKFIQNVTGGLLGGDEAKSVKDLRADAVTGNSFLEYVTNGIMLPDGGLECDMTPYVQSIVLPNIHMLGVEDQQTQLGTFTSSGFIVEPDTHEINLDVVNTKLPLIESMFYPWMREVTMPCWMYDDQPYTTAHIVINLHDHADVKYHFYGCYPIYVQTYDPSMQLNSQFTRQVRLRFQMMTINSKLKTKESALDKLKSLGGTLKNAALGMI